MKDVLSMADQSSPRGHRSTRRRLAATLAPVAALAVVVSQTGRADAAAPEEVRADCAASSDRLASCDFVDSGYKVNFGSNERVSSEQDNCASEEPSLKTFTITAQSMRILQDEDGHVADSSSMLAGSIVGVGHKMYLLGFDIEGENKGKSFSVTLSGQVKPGYKGYVMWSSKRLDVSGYYRAVYKEAQDGQTEFYSPSKGGSSVHVFYPIMLDNDLPDGRMWIRNVPCSSYSGPGVSLAAAYGEAGGEVVDEELAWPQ